MSFLPRELEQEILLRVPFQSLREVCASPYLEDLCLSRAFWVEKFRSSGLPPPSSKRRTIGEWIEYYDLALYSKEMADRDLEKMSNGFNVEYHIPLGRVNNPELLVVPGLSLETVEEFLALQRESENLSHEFDYLTTLQEEGEATSEEEQRLEEIDAIIPTVRAYISYSDGIVTYGFEAYSDDYNTIETLEEPLDSFPQLWELLYRLFLHRVILV